MQISQSFCYLTTKIWAKKKIKNNHVGSRCSNYFLSKTVHEASAKCWHHRCIEEKNGEAIYPLLKDCVLGEEGKTTSGNEFQRRTVRPQFCSVSQKRCNRWARYLSQWNSMKLKSLPLKYRRTTYTCCIIGTRTSFSSRPIQATKAIHTWRRYLSTAVLDIQLAAGTYGTRVTPIPTYIFVYGAVHTFRRLLSDNLVNLFHN